MFEAPWIVIIAGACAFRMDEENLGEAKESQMPMYDR
jgi:hypothetical protein